VVLERTLEHWLNTPERQLRWPPASADPGVRALHRHIDSAQEQASRCIKDGPAMDLAEGRITVSEFERACASTLVQQIRPDPVEGDSQGYRMSFQRTDAREAIRHQVLGESFVRLADGDPDTASNLGRMLSRFLEAVEIFPRLPRRIRR
jgi:hypothetical protein